MPHSSHGLLGAAGGLPLRLLCWVVQLFFSIERSSPPPPPPFLYTTHQPLSSPIPLYFVSLERLSGFVQVLMYSRVLDFPGTLAHRVLD